MSSRCPSCTVWQSAGMSLEHGEAANNSNKRYQERNKKGYKIAYAGVWSSGLVWMAEEESVRRGCWHVHLDTLGLPALPLYQHDRSTIWGSLTMNRREGSTYR